MQCRIIIFIRRLIRSKAGLPDIVLAAARKLFNGFLTVAPKCRVCGLDYSFADSGDGPAAFVILIIGFIVVGSALWMEVNYGPPLWVHFILWVPLAIILSLVAMRSIKGILINMQYRNKASQGRLDDGK